MKYISLEPLADKDDFETFENVFLSTSQVILVIGKRRSGKTGIGLRLSENKIATAKVGAYAVGFPRELPAPFKRVSSIENVPNNSLAFMDEIGILHPSKRASSDDSLTLGEVLYLAGQKDITLIGTTQYAIGADLNIVRNADVLIIKEPSLFQIQTERTFLKKFLRITRDALSVFPPEERKKYAYLYSDYFSGIVKFELPSFWSNEISYAFKDINIKRG